jgi:hypothetical protein
MSFALYLRYVHVRRGEGHVGHSHQQDRPGASFPFSLGAQRRAMSMAFYLRCVYVCSGGEGHAAIPISKAVQRFFPFQYPGSEEGYEHGFVSQVCVHVHGGEKSMFAIPISKTDQRFFPFQPQGSEEGYEHGYVSQVCVYVRSGREGHVRHSHQQD